LPGKAETLLPSKAELPSMPKASRPPIQMAEPVPLSTSPANESPPQPAAFAAILQSLPAPEAAPKQEHVAAAADDSPSSADTPMLAVIPEPKPDTAHRSSILTASVPVPVQDSRWGERFSERVVWITGQHVEAAEIHVEPAHLGPIEVRISVVNDQANLLITAPHAVARDAIQLSLPRLHDMLVDSGLTLGNVAVGAHTAGQDKGRQRDGLEPSGAQPSERVLEPGSQQLNSALRRAWGLVDLFA
jgi:flagellar hook-length control protein FliK